METVQAQPATGTLSLLRHMRESRGITREELAADAHIAVRTLVNAEAGTTTPNRSTKHLLATALNCRVDVIWPSNESSPTVAAAGSIKPADAGGGRVSAG